MWISSNEDSARLVIRADAPDAGPHSRLLCFGPTGDWLCRYPADTPHSDHAPYVEGEYLR